MSYHDADDTAAYYRQERRIRYRSHHREPRESYSEEEAGYIDTENRIHLVSRGHRPGEIHIRRLAIRVQAPPPSRSRSRDHRIEHEDSKSRRPRTASNPFRPYLSRDDPNDRLSPSDADNLYRRERQYGRVSNRPSSAEPTTSRYSGDYSRGRLNGHRRLEADDIPRTYERERISSLDRSQGRRMRRAGSEQNRAETEERRRICHTYSHERDRPEPSTRRGSFHSSRSSQTLITRTLPLRESTDAIPILPRDAIYQDYKVQGAEFRVLCLLPGTTSMIKCELIPASLEGHPKYRALSYAWGDPDDTVRIQVNRCSLNVTSSLHGALVVLRKKHKPVFLWADAVCINQQDKGEQSRQVQMMTQIYRQAESVVVWLGPEADDSEHAMALLKEVSRITHDDRAMNNLIASKENRVRFTALVDLFERDYWDRLWVVQEVLNAKYVTVYCGNISLPWSVYINATKTIERHVDQLQHYFSPDHMGLSMISPRQQFSYDYILTREGPASLEMSRLWPDAGPMSLLDVLYRCRSKLSSEPRDKVFGVLGILPQSIEYKFPPNYNASLREVYTNVVDFLLHATRRFDVICAAIHFPKHTSVTKLPSWVPDWSHIPGVIPLGGNFSFSAAGDTKAEFGFVDRALRTKLEVSAIYLGKVDWLGTAVGTFNTLYDFLMAFLHWRALLLDKWPIQDDQMHEAFCRTLCLDKLSGYKVAEWVRVCYHVFASLFQEWLPYMQLDDELQRYARLEMDVLQDDRDKLFQDKFRHYMVGRRFFTTDNGLMGMGTGFMNMDDIVCVPLGSSTPVILREERNGEYSFVGDTYVDGYMYGRAVEEHRYRRRELKKYVLR